MNPYKKLLNRTYDFDLSQMSDLSPEAANEQQALRLSRAASTRTWVYTSNSQNPGPPPPLEDVPGSFPEDTQSEETTPIEGPRPLPQPPLTPIDDFTHIRHSNVQGFDGSNPIFPTTNRRPLPTVPPLLPNPHNIESPPSTSSNARRRRMPFVGGFISSMKRAMMSPHAGSGFKTPSRSGTVATIPESEASTLPVYRSTATVPLPPAEGIVGNQGMSPLPENASYVEAMEMPEPTPFTKHSTLAPTSPVPRRQSIMTTRTRTSHAQTPWTRHSTLPGGDTPVVGEIVPHPADEESAAVPVEPLPTADYAKMGDSSLLSETRSPRSRPMTYLSSTTQSTPTSTTDSIAMFFHRLYHLPWISHNRITEDYRPGDGMPHRKKWNTTSISWYNSAKDRNSIDLLSNGTSPPTSPVTPLKRSHYRPSRERISRPNRSHMYSSSTTRGGQYHHHSHGRDSRLSTYTPRRSPRAPSRANTRHSSASPRYFQPPAQPMYIIQPPPAVAQPVEAHTASPATLTSPLLMVIPSLPATMSTSGEGARYPLFSPPAGSTALASQQS